MCAHSGPCRCPYATASVGPWVCVCVRARACAYMCVFVCVCARARARVCLRMRACVRACVLCAWAQAIVSAVGEDEDVMTPKCLTSILDIILSLVAVGIPERVKARNEEEVEAAGQEEEQEQEQEQEEEEDTNRREQPRTRGQDSEALSPSWTRGDSLECLLLDGTLAVQLTALRYAPWHLMHYVCLRLPRSHLAARRTLVLLLCTAYRLAPQRFVDSVCELPDLDALAEACGCALVNDDDAGCAG